MKTYRIVIDKNEEMVGYLTMEGRSQIDAIRRYFKTAYGKVADQIVKYNRYEYSALVTFEGHQDYFEFAIFKK